MISLDQVPLVMAYLGPEILMPLASAAAAVGGVLLIFWRTVVHGTKSMFKRIGGVFRRGP